MNQLNPHIDWVCHRIAGPCVLTTGCNAGTLALLQEHTGLTCTEIDLDPGVAALPFANESFDTVILADTLQRTAEPEALVAEAGRVLRSHGRILITVPVGLTDRYGDRQAYNPVALGRLLDPYFRTDAVDVLAAHIGYEGRKRPAGNHPARSADARLEELQHLSSLLERCFIECDRAALDTKRRLSTRVASLAVQAGALTNTILELQQETPAIEADRSSLQDRLRDITRATTPPRAIVLVISRGEPRLIELDGRLGWHFPQMDDGVYAGHHPKDSEEAIAHLEALRSRGAEYLVIPNEAFWWLEFYAEFRTHLESACRTVAFDKEAGIVYELRAPLPDDEPLRPTTTRRPRTVTAAILDEFSTACLGAETRLIAFRPDDWMKTLEDDAPELLLVESAWFGNRGAWQLQLNAPNARLDDLKALVEYCRRRRIPTVFWNKEDPPHFSQFIHNARLFDYIFTSDSDCIGRYCEAVGHARVFALPFAAQPALHNPLLDQPRDGAVCFAGAYHALRHDERRKDMETILRPALDFGLHIFDRNHSLTGPGYDRLRFPDVYQPAIKGRLPYNKMVAAYKRYKIFLNVNSVKSSPTMFSRRVFELLACGTAVVSAYARGIEELLGRDVVHIAETPEETRRHLERLLHDEDAWLRASVRGIRRVFDGHTYAHRLAYVRRQVGLDAGEVADPLVSVVARIGSGRALARLEETLTTQTYRRLHVTLVLSQSGLEAAVHVFARAMGSVAVAVFSSTSAIEQIAQGVPGEYVWFPVPADFYGPDFLRDCVQATRYSSADVIGKSAYFRAGSNATVTVENAGTEFSRGQPLTAGAQIIRRGALRRMQLAAMLAGHLPDARGLGVVAIDRFNYVRAAYAPGTLAPRLESRALEAVVV